MINMVNYTCEPNEQGLLSKAVDRKYMEAHFFNIPWEN